MQYITQGKLLKSNKSLTYTFSDSKLCELIFESQLQIAAFPLTGFSGGTFKYWGMAPDNIFFQNKAPYNSDMFYGCNKV